MQAEEEGEKRKKKKRKHKAEEGENEEGGTEGSRGADATSDVGTTVETHTSPPPAKKKKKKKTKESEPPALDAPVSAVNADKREPNKDSDAPDPLSDADFDPSPPKKKKKKKKHVVEKEADVVRPAPAVCGDEEESMALATSIDQECSAKSKKKRERPIVIEEPPLKEVEEGSVVVGEMPSAVNDKDGSLMTAKKRKKHRAAVGESESTMEEPTAASLVLVPSNRKEVEVGYQSLSSAVVMTTEGMEEVQAHKSPEAGGETSEQKHKKKKKTKSKEAIVECIDLTAEDGGMEAVGGEGEDEVPDSHTKKRKSKKHHKKEDNSSGCHDNEEASHESKAKRKKTKMAAPHCSE